MQANKYENLQDGLSARLHAKADQTQTLDQSQQQQSPQGIER